MARGRQAIRLLAATVLLLGTASCARFSARMELKKGNEAYKQGKYAKAVELYQGVPEGFPERVYAALNTGYAHMAQYKRGSKHVKDQEHAGAAVKAYDEYIRIRPADADPKHFPPPGKIEEYMIELLSDSERFDEALARLEKQLALTPDNPALLRAIAATYDKWGKAVRSIDYFRRWADLYPEDSAPHISIAAYCWNMSYRQGPYMDSLERNRWVDIGLQAADQALAINPEQIEGITYKNLLLRERAKLRIDPDDVALVMRDAIALHERAKELNLKKKAAEEAAKAQPTPTPGEGPS